MEICIIAAVAHNGVIGRDGTIPWNIAEDMKRFRDLTLGHAVVMGRKTFESIGKPLPNRDNYVISQSWQGGEPARYSDMEFALCFDPLEVLEEVPDTTEKLFVCGGSRVYEMFLPYANSMELTLVRATPDGDTFFPYMNTQSMWDAQPPWPWRVVSERSYVPPTDAPACRFVRFERIGS